MNKGDLIDRLAKEAKITKGQAADALDAFLSGVTSALGKGDKVTLVGFG
ncbi:MAG TPA: HU family DNA-binding protein, partial [Arachidicoccus sp.]